jgi:hypothetical protein
MGGFLLLHDPLHAIFADYHAPAWRKQYGYAFVVIITFTM